ncbi:MAG: DUF5340 domain-containing protein [Nodosilinea sp. LVE1205-7]
MDKIEKSVSLPAPIHYELLLQLLEQQTMAVAYQNPRFRQPVHELIVTVRKALSQQRQLEDLCKQANMTVQYKWSINQVVDDWPSP